MKKYKVIWKGKCIGEFTRTEISENLDLGKIGLIHEVEVSCGNYTSVKDFLNSDKVNEISENREFEFSLFGYMIVGFSFLSWVGMFCGILYAIFLFRDKKKNLGMQIFSFSIIFWFMGYLFFNAFSNF